jgi:hypothetical protein
MQGVTGRLRLLSCIPLVAFAAACAGSLRLMTPEVAESLAREDATRVDVEPFETRPGLDARVQSGETIDAHPNPAAAVTAGFREEIAGRALHGGDPAGATVKCTLDRFAVRVTKGVTSKNFGTLYVDAACDVARTTDGALQWRGELRGRAAPRGGMAFDRGSAGLEHLVSRMLSDATREMASDLIVRVLGLQGTSSARAFQDEAQHADLAGIDDGPIGDMALAEKIDRAAIDVALGDPVVSVRGAAWNAVAMSVGPGDPWPLGDTFIKDDDARVRFYQYKALARQASAATLVQLQAAARTETDAMLAELAADAIASGGIGSPRLSRLSRLPRLPPSPNAITVTKGTTTSP